MSIKSIKITSFNEIQNLLEDKTYAFVFLQPNEGSFIGYDLKVLSNQKEIESVLPIEMFYDNEIREIGLLNTERFYKLSNQNNILIAQAIEYEV